MGVCVLVPDVGADAVGEGFCYPGEHGVCAFRVHEDVHPVADGFGLYLAAGFHWVSPSVLCWLVIPKP